MKKSVLVAQGPCNTCAASRKVLFWMAIPSHSQVEASTVEDILAEYILACLQFHPTTVVKPRGKICEAFKVLKRSILV